MLKCLDRNILQLSVLRQSKYSESCRDACACIFSLAAYCCSYLEPSLPYINQPKLPVANVGYYYYF